MFIHNNFPFILLTMFGLKAKNRTYLNVRICVVIPDIYVVINIIILILLTISI